MASTPRELMDRARKTLCDPDAVHWTEEELLCYLNEALCELAGIRPDQFVEMRRVPLVPGECQTVPEDCIDLVSIEGNVADGVKTEDPITQVTSTAGDRLGNKFKCAADDTPDGEDGEQDPCEAYLVQGFKITASSHGFFTVSPAVPAECTGDSAVEIDALFYCEPPKLDEDSTDCVLPCHYEAQLVDYVIMRAFEKDIESQYAQQRAAYHRNKFYEGVNADYRAASRLRSGYILGQEGTGAEQTGWRNDIRGVYG